MTDEEYTDIALSFWLSVELDPVDAFVSWLSGQMYGSEE